MVYSNQLLALFRGATHGGSLPDATHQGTAGTPGAGPCIQLWLRVQDGVVEAARFKAWGCPAAIACSEATARWCEGQALAALASVTLQQVLDWVGGVPEGKEHCPALAASACQNVWSGEHRRSEDPKE